MTNENINAIVNSAFESDVVAMRDALYNSINDKIFDAIAQKKQAIAQNLINVNNTEPAETE